MASASDTSIRFSEHEPEELSDYKPLNRAAVAAVVLGAGSGLAPFHPAFCVIPAIGVLVGITSLRQLHTSDVRQSGRYLAVFGLFLSLFFCSWAIARESSRRQHLYDQAKDFADHWFQLLRDGKLYEAHQLTLTEENRIAPGASLEKYYLPNKNASAAAAAAAASGPALESALPPNEQFANFFSGKAPERIRNMGSSMTSEFQSRTGLAEGGGSINTALEYVVRGTIDSQPQTVRIRIALDRKRDAATADWRISDIQIVESGS